MELEAGFSSVSPCLFDRAAQLVICKQQLQLIELRKHVSALQISYDDLNSKVYKSLHNIIDLNKDIVEVYTNLDVVFNFLREETAVLRKALTRLQQQPEDSNCTACRCAVCVDLVLSRSKTLGEGMKIFAFSSNICSLNGSRVHLKPGAVQRKLDE